MKVKRLQYFQLLKHFSVDQTGGLTDRLTIALHSAMPLVTLQTCTICDSSSVCGKTISGCKIRHSHILLAAATES